MSYSRSTAPRWRGLLCAGIAGVIAMGAGAFWYVHATMTTTPLGHTANDGSDVGIMLGLADGAYQDKRLVAPIGSNVYEFYSSVLQLDPHNAMAEKRLRESFEPACAVIEHALNDGDLDEAQREITFAARLRRTQLPACIIGRCTRCTADYSGAST